MKKFLLIAILSFFNFLSYAHGGRTDSNGCHNCRTGACAGTYHCHNGGTYVAPNPQAQIIVQQQPTINQNQEYNAPTPINNPKLNPENDDNSIKEQKEEIINNQKKAESNFGILSTIFLALIGGSIIFSMFNKS
jgi:hypothetical protein